MAFIPAVNAALVTLVFKHEVNNKIAVNTLWFECTIDPGNAQLADLYEMVEMWATDAWSPLAVNDWRLNQIRVRNMTTENGAEYSGNPLIPGLINADPMPSNVTISVSFRTGLSGRSFRGRNYFVGLPRTAVIDDDISPTAITNINDGYEGLIAQVSGSDWTWVVASFQTDGAPRASALLTPVTHVLVVDSELDHQDRRLRAP